MYLFREGSSNTDDTLWVNVQGVVKDAEHPLLGQTQTKQDEEKSIHHIPLLFHELDVGKWFFRDGMAEKPLIKWVRSKLSKDKVFIDIGAHIGTYALTCAPNTQHTWAFECSPKNFCYLAANVALHELTDKISPIPFALGNKPGNMKYYIRSKDGGGNGIKVLSDQDSKCASVDVHVRTLDSFDIQNVGMIKIDVEGFEKEVLEGAVETLKKSGYPPIVFESWGDWKEREGVPARQIRHELFTYLAGLGYQIHEIDGVRDMFYAARNST